MKVKTSDFEKRCNCREVDCEHNAIPDFAGLRALKRLVFIFARALYTKLEKKFYEGKHGWDAEDYTPEIISQQILKHIRKGDPIDVGNLCMFLWNRDANIITPAEYTESRLHDQRLNKALEALQDIRDHGLRCDLHPTMVDQLESPDKTYDWFCKYLERIEAGVKDRAGQAIKAIEEMR